MPRGKALMHRALKSLLQVWVTLCVAYVSLHVCTHFFLSFFFFLEITAPTLWIKHLVIKDSKLNNTNVRNSGKKNPSIMYVFNSWSLGAPSLPHDYSSCRFVFFSASFLPSLSSAFPFPSSPLSLLPPLL